MYKSSTNPNESSLYSHHNGINATMLKTTGDLKVVNPPVLVVGTTVTPTVYNLDNVSYQAVTSTSGALKKYLLQTPVAGARKTILCNPLGAGDVYLYASATASRTVHFGSNTSENIMGMTTCENILVNLIGASSKQWLIESISTLNNGTTGKPILRDTNT